MKTKMKALLEDLQEQAAVLYEVIGEAQTKRNTILEIVFTLQNILNTEETEPIKEKSHLEDVLARLEVIDKEKETTTIAPWAKNALEFYVAQDARNDFDKKDCGNFVLPEGTFKHILPQRDDRNFPIYNDTTYQADVQHQTDVTDKNEEILGFKMSADDAESLRVAIAASVKADKELADENFRWNKEQWDLISKFATVTIPVTTERSIEDPDSETWVI